MLGRVWRDRKRSLAYVLRRYPLAQGLLRGAAWFFGARFTVGVVGVVLNDSGRILLVEHVFHPRRPWGLPGGWLKSGEPPAVGLAREIAEETGLRVDVLRPLLVDRAPGSLRHLDVAFLCEACGDVTSLSREILSHDWMWPTDVPPLVDFHQAAVDALLDQLAVEEPAP